MRKKHNDRDLRIKSKLWIEIEGEPVFGRGRRFLLEAIDTHGSINRAAKKTGVSFRRAWSHIKAMEDRLGMQLVERTVGGRNGGGAVITPGARTLLRRFEALENGVREFVDERFDKLFKGGPHV
jgi:molybdate transport system regulatory protein